MRKKQEVQWFILPLDKFTWEAISSALAETADAFDEVFLKIPRGGEEKLIRLPKGRRVIIDRMLKIKKADASFKFRVFKRRGERQCLEEWRFPAKKIKFVGNKKMTGLLKKRGGKK